MLLRLWGHDWPASMGDSRPWVMPRLAKPMQRTFGCHEWLGMDGRPSGFTSARFAQLGLVA